MDGLSAPCYNRGMMKKAAFLSFVLLLTAFFAFGCAKEAVENVSITGPSASQDVQGGVVLTPFVTEAPANAGKASVETTALVAYAYEAAGSPALYGAVAYKNTGTANVMITKAAFTFRAGETTVEHEFEPVLAQYDVVAPGETSFVTLWLTDSTIPAGTEVTLEAKLTCAAAQNTRVDLKVTNLFLADNYPKFTTMSGTVTNAASTECAFFMTYVGFYDENENLLGVWYFTKNVRLEAGGGIDFVTRMEDLPINGLSETAKTMVAGAFGFNYE